MLQDLDSIFSCSQISNEFCHSMAMHLQFVLAMHISNIYAAQYIDRHFIKCENCPSFLEGFFAGSTPWTPVS